MIGSNEQVVTEFLPMKIDNFEVISPFPVFKETFRPGIRRSGHTENLRSITE